MLIHQNTRPKLSLHPYAIGTQKVSLFLGHLSDMSIILLHIFMTHLQSGTNKLGVGLGAERLGPLNRGTHGAVDDELGKDAERAGNTEEDGVVRLLGEAVVLEEDTGVGVDVGVRVLGLAVLGEDTRGDLVHLADELEHGVVGQVLLGKLALGNVAGVSLAENGVAVARNDLTSLEGGPKVLLDGFVAEVVADGLLHPLEPDKHFLVGQSVERTGKTVQASSERKVGRAEGGTDQVSGVRANVAALVVGVDSEVETHQLNKVLVISEAELVGQVPGVILVLLNGSNAAIFVDVAVDFGGDGGKLGDKVHRILEGVLPVLGLLHSLSISLGEVGLALKSSDSEGELSHGVEVGRAAVDELLDELGDIGTGSPVGRQVADLLLRRNLASQEKPEETLGKRLLATRGLGKDILALGDLLCVITYWQTLRRHTYGLATEADALFRVENGALPDERLDATGTTVDLVESDLTNDLVAVFPVSHVNAAMRISGTTARTCGAS